MPAGNKKAWGGNGWIPKDVRDAYKFIDDSGKTIHKVPLEVILVDGLPRHNSSNSIHRGSASLWMGTRDLCPLVQNLKRKRSVSPSVQPPLEDKNSLPEPTTKVQRPNAFPTIRSTAEGKKPMVNESFEAMLANITIEELQVKFERATIAEAEFRGVICHRKRTLDDLFLKKEAGAQVKEQLQTAYEKVVKPWTDPNADPDTVAANAIRLEAAQQLRDQMEQETTSFTEAFENAERNLDHAKDRHEEAHSDVTRLKTIIQAKQAYTLPWQEHIEAFCEMEAIAETENWTELL